MPNKTFAIKKPCTVYIHFANPLPNDFRIYHEKHGLYYFRKLDGKTPRIKFNVCHPGNYSSDNLFSIVNTCPIEIPKNLPSLPEYERGDIKDFAIIDNPDMKGSPARIFYKQGVIEKGKDFYSYPKPIRVFFLLHEVGHFFYGINKEDIDKANAMSESDAKQYLSKRRNESEMKCDLFAFIKFLEMGYNRSTAFYSLSRVLKSSPENIQRIREIAKNIQSTQKQNIYE